MGKDPAFLFYPGDWQGGTSTLSRFLKGCYMDILIAQFNNGHLSLEEIKTVLGSDFGQSWPTIQKKFKKDSTGLFFNVKLETETIKRIEYSKSRAKNRNGTKHVKNISGTHVPTHVKHVENGDGNEDGNKLEKRDFSKPDVEGDEIIFPIDTPEVRQAWAQWKEYRFKQNGEKYGFMGEQAALKLLSTMGEEQIKATILKAIESKWKNLYPDNNVKNGNTSTKGNTRSAEQIDGNKRYAGKL